MDWTNSLYGFLGAQQQPGTSSIPLSTPVNTSGNASNSGSNFGNFFSGLANFGTTAANAYATVAGAGRRPSSGTTSAGYSGPSSLSVNLPSWAKWAIGAGIAIGVIVLGVVLFKKNK